MRSVGGGCPHLSTTFYAVRQPLQGVLHKLRLQDRSPRQHALLRLDRVSGFQPLEAMFIDADPPRRYREQPANSWGLERKEC